MDSSSIPVTAAVPPAAERLHPLRELTLVRMREFLREPEAVFWVFAFPVIMTCALGVAFRSRADEPVIVGIERGARSMEVERGARAQRRLRHPRDRPGRRRPRPARWPRAGGGRPRRAADLPLRSGPGGEPGRPALGGRRPAARRRPHRRVRSAPGRRPRRRLALYRLAGPRAARHEHHGHGDVEHELRDRHGAHPQAAQAAGRDADAADGVPAVAAAQPPGVPGRRGRRAGGLRLGGLRRRRARQPRRPGARLPDRARWPSAASRCSPPAGPRRSKASRACSTW